MKKVTIYHYHGKMEEWESRTGYEHLQEYPALNFSMISIIMEEIFKAGLNVMLVHTDEDSAILYVDDRRFKQR